MSIYQGEFNAFSAFDRVAIQTLVQMSGSGCALEIGSWLGNGSTIELASTCNELYCVDHWQGNPNVKRHQDIIEQYDAFSTFRHNTKQYWHNIRPMVMSSKDAAKIIVPNSFDLVFIDANHSYVETLADIKLWRSKVKRGGILCGHDCEGRPSDFGRQWLEQHKDLDSIEARTFPRIHPGCILAVDEIFKGNALLFAESPITLANGQKGYSTIWFIEINAQ